MIVITSAASIEPEFRAEFGALPPCMLPLGNRRLYQHQLAVLGRAFPGEPVCLSLPEGFVLSGFDQRRLREAGVSLVAVPEGLSLAESLAFVVNSVGHYEQPLRVLHGDTLIEDIPAGEDLVSVSTTRDDYRWEVEVRDDHEETVWSGYFAFADIRLLMRSLVRSRRDFVRAVRDYDASRPLRRAPVLRWHDLGHINTYHASRARMTTERAFNRLSIGEGVVVKSGEPAAKIRAEAQWFRRAPPAVRRYCPQLLEERDEDGRPSYVLEYLHLTPLNELFVHARNPPFFWDRVFGRIGAFLATCARAAEPAATAPGFAGRLAGEFRALVEDKTLARLAAFAAGPGGIALDRPLSLNGSALPPLREIAADCMRRALAVPVAPGVLHGDLCLSNILFDGRAGDIKVVDPRGVDATGELSLYGNLCYDLAKLLHSVVGLYDFIIAGAFTLERPAPAEFRLHIDVDPRIESIQALLLNRRFLSPGVDPASLLPLTVLLFLSMLPLHADDPGRQAALLANGLRLYGLCATSG